MLLHPIQFSIRYILLISYSSKEGTLMHPRSVRLSRFYWELDDLVKSVFTEDYRILRRLHQTWHVRQDDTSLYTSAKQVLITPER